MRILLFITTLLTSFNCFADTQSQEEYIQEINKAFERYFEATNGKTFSQQIIAMEQLYEEYEGNEAVQDMLLQQQADTYAFLGQYHMALVASDSRGAEPEELNEEVKSLHFQNALNAILEKSIEHQIVMINEAHHVPQHRALTYQLLQGLWEQGYRYLALEALAENAEQNLTKAYIPANAGHYTKEPIFANLLSHAQQLGFELVSYDYGFEILSSTEAREKSAAKNIREKIFNHNPDAKVLIHVGYNHINEDGWLAYQLKELLGLNPLTINQTEIRERSQRKYESETYAWLTANHSFEAPIVLINEANEFWSDRPEKYDVNVIWPRAQYSQNRPEWARLGRNLAPVDTNWCQETFPCTVEVYTIDSAEGVPSDRVVLSTDQDSTGIFISPSSSKIVATSSEGNILHTEKLGDIVNYLNLSII